MYSCASVSKMKQLKHKVHFLALFIYFFFQIKRCPNCPDWMIHVPYFIAFGQRRGAFTAIAGDIQRVFERSHGAFRAH